MSIVNIQKKLKLKEDGVLGPITAKAIASHLKLSPIEASHFLGQCAHETGNWRSFKENLNYSAQGLANTWPNRYAVDSKQRPLVPNELANKIQRNQELIANHTYASRMGNGDVNSGDGFKFIGRGAIQLTGRSNYTEFSKYVNDPSILENPEKVATEYVLESAKWFFDRNKLWALCLDTSDKSIETVTRRINGGTHGLADRKEKTLAFLKLLS